MFERILENGLLLSEWPPGSDPHQHRFLIRNRVIAALTKGTVVVEASARSGARQTAGRTRDLLARHDGNVSSAAKAADIDRKTFHRLINKYGLRG